MVGASLMSFINKLVRARLAAGEHDAAGARESPKAIGKKDQ